MVRYVEHQRQQQRVAGRGQVVAGVVMELEAALQGTDTALRVADQVGRGRQRPEV
jgi:hypothetical protein